MLDLHMHLDGSLPISVVRELLLLNYSELNDELKRIISNEEELKAKLQVPPTCNSLKEYLKCFDLPLKLLQTEEAVSYAVKRLLEELKAEGMRYVEIRFAPQFHSERIEWYEKLDYETEIVKAAINASKQVPGIKANFILCLMRGQPFDANTRTLRIAEALKNKGVVAVDLAGDEAEHPTFRYRTTFAIARDMGLDFTIHAGEAGTTSQKIKSLKDAIGFGAKRIGHGVALVLDSSLKDLCKKRGIGIECCPRSNIQTKAFGCIEFHPIYEFMRDRLKVSVNTDNRTVSNTKIAKEFQVLKLSEEEKNILIKNAIDTAFLSEAEKKEIFPEWVK